MQDRAASQSSNYIEALPETGKGRQFYSGLGFTALYHTGHVIYPVSLGTTPAEMGVILSRGKEREAGRIY